MNKLLSALLAAALASSALAAAPSAPKTDAKPAAEQIVTPQSQEAAFKEIVDKMKSDAKAAKPADAKK